MLEAEVESREDLLFISTQVSSSEVSFAKSLSKVYNEKFKIFF